MSENKVNYEKRQDQKPLKHKLSEEQLKALLGKTCRGRRWFLMKKSNDLNKLALFLKINGVDRIELGQKAYTYEVDLKDETIAGAFILTEKQVGSVGADGKRIGDDAAGNSVAADAAGDDAADDQNPADDSGTRWYIAACVVAPEFRGHDIGKIMLNKMKKLAQDEGADAIYVKADEDTVIPDSVRAAEDAEALSDRADGAEGAAAILDRIDGAEDAAAFWEALGFVDWGDGLLVCTLN